MLGKPYRSYILSPQVRFYILGKNAALEDAGGDGGRDAESAEQRPTVHDGCLFVHQTLPEPVLYQTLS